MNQKDEENLGRWLDGELSPDESAAFEARIDSEPELAASAKELRALHDLLKDGANEERQPPSPDFFNSQLIRQIEEEDRASARATSSSSEGAGIFDFLKLPWLIAAGATAMALFLLVTGNTTGTGIAPALEHTAITSTYTPGEGVNAKTFYSEEADATVLVLDGLEEIPADRKLTAHRAVSYAPDALAGANHLYDENGDLLLVMVEGNGQRPGFIAQ